MGGRCWQWRVHVCDTKSDLTLENRTYTEYNLHLVDHGCDGTGLGKAFEVTGAIA